MLISHRNELMLQKICFCFDSNWKTSGVYQSYQEEMKIYHVNIFLLFLLLSVCYNYNWNYKVTGEHCWGIEWFGDSTNQIIVSTLHELILRSEWMLELKGNLLALMEFPGAKEIVISMLGEMKWNSEFFNYGKHFANIRGLWIIIQTNKLKFQL